MGIELSSDELNQYMLKSPRVILCVTREGRAPLALPMWFGWKDQTIYMRTVLASKKVSHIRKNPLVSCLVESGEEYFSLKAALLIGYCEIVDDQERARALEPLVQTTKPIYQDYWPKQMPPHIAKIYQAPMAMLCVRPTSITTWDFSKVRL